MKRMLIRLGFVSGVVGLGATAVVQAQKSFQRPIEQSADSPLPATARHDAPGKPIPLTADAVGEDTNARDPFAVHEIYESRQPLADARAVQPAAHVLRPGQRVVEQAAEYEPLEEGAGEPTPAVADPQAMVAASKYAEPRRLDPAAVGESETTGRRVNRQARGQSPRAGADAGYARQAGADQDVEDAVGLPPLGSQDINNGGEPQPVDPAAMGDFSEGDENSLNNFAAPSRSVGNRPSDQQPDRGTALRAGGPRDDAAAGLGTGRPGEKRLEGSQAPSLTIEKTAPPEIQVGKPATFTIKVRNTGQVAAQGVEVHDEVPHGTRLVNTTPQAARSPAGTLVWDLGSVKPGGEATLQMQVMPLAEGEIGSVATLHFRAGASARTTSTKPQLTIEVSGPAKVMIGEESNLKIRLSNPGTGVATGVVLTETVPPGLRHPAGEELEFEVGVLKPGERRELELTLTAAQAGVASNVLMAHGDAGLEATGKADIEVIAPELKVGLTGPKRRYLERSAVYNVSVSNPGTAPAKDVELTAVLPKGLKFVDANNAGQYDAATHSVYWSLEELPPQETGTVTLTAQPIEAGELKLQVKGKAQRGLADEHEETVSVEGIAAILFELVDVNDPIEVGGETAYEIRVINQGSKAATNVRLVALVPPQLKVVSADGPVRYTVDGQRVLFEPLSNLAPKADTTYTVRVQALEAGDLRLRVQVVTDEIRSPVTKEESTRVYADE